MRQSVATVTMMDSSILLALTLFATLVTGNGNLEDKDGLPTATRDIKAFPACITDSDCARVTGLGGEVADFKCFQSMCFPWANKELQAGQVEHTSCVIFMLVITATAIAIVNQEDHQFITQATCTKSSQCDSGHCFRYFTLLVWANISKMCHIVRGCYKTK